MIAVAAAAGYGAHAYFSGGATPDGSSEAGLAGAPTAACLSALGEGCTTRPCPVDQVKTSLRGRVQAADAEDIAHDLLLEICMRATPLDTAEAWRKAYLGRADWRATDAYRRAGRWDKAKCKGAFRSDGMYGSDYRDAETDHADLYAALCALSEKNRCVVHARYYDDLSDSEIARQCSLPLDAMVRQQLTRARKILRNLMEQGRPAVAQPEAD